jgi:hypothetical protein
MLQAFSACRASAQFGHKRTLKIMAMQTVSIAFGALATLLGLYYSFLGLSAVRHLRKADEIDRVAGWTLLWCLDTDRYELEGKRLCKIGLIVSLCSAALWIGAFTVHRVS